MTKDLTYWRELQEQIELTQYEKGLQRYQQLRENGLKYGLKPEQDLIVANMQNLTEAIQEVTTQYIQGTCSRVGLRKWGPMLAAMEPEKLAFLTLSTLIEQDAADHSMTAVCLAVGSKVKHQRDFEVLKSNHIDVINKFKHVVKAWDKKAVSKAKRAANAVDTIKWNKNTCLHVGAVLVSLAVDHTSIFEMVEYFRNGQTHRRIKIKDEVIQQLDKLHQELAIFHPVYHPMVLPPLPWEKDLSNGGYYFIKYSLVTDSSGQQQDHLHTLRNTNTQFIRDVVNKVQEVAYEINPFVLKVFKQLWVEEGGGVADLPNYDLLPLPEMKDEYVDEERKLIRQARYVIHNENYKQISKRRATNYILHLAEEYHKYGIYYTPWFTDYRWRIYPRTNYLNPQGPDLCKSLLRYKQKKPLGKRGYYWLKIHIVNCFGLDKLPTYEDKIKAYDSLASKVMQIATAPMVCKLWQSDDCDSWQLLAACREMYEAHQLNDPTAYESGLVLPIDGSCNGLQHYSALGRDLVGAEATNLTNATRYNDIYGQVAEECNRIVQEELLERNILHETDEYKQEIITEVLTYWAKVGIDRWLPKQPVMTTPYGVTFSGILDQIIGNKKFKAIDAIKTKHIQHANVLRHIINAAILRKVQAARVYMEWLQAVADIASKAGKPLVWTLPTGATVIQETRDLCSKQIPTALYTLSLQFYDKDKAPLNGYKQKRAIAPNYIHSLDAAHMMLTAHHWFYTLNKTSLTPVHDSFGTHACDVDDLQRTLLDKFHELHSLNVIERFRDEIQSQLETPLPDLPEYGSYNIDEVLNARYAFS